jgi:pyruvate formate lyase activating enzyme
MKIGGFVKQSFIDYPGKMAAVVFTSGCNFRCGYCHNPQLVLPELIQNTAQTDEQEVFEFLTRRLNWLDAVVVTGGEPTLHSDLPDFLRKLKNLGFLIKLDTNGSDSEMLQHVIDRKLVDYVAMDIKTLLKEDAYAEITGISSSSVFAEILKSISVLKKSTINVEFRTTWLPRFDKDTVEVAIRQVIGPDMQYTVNQYREGYTIKDYTS